jgi:hypothetical protein
MTAVGAWAEEFKLTAAISAPMVELYAAFYDHHRTTATTYVNDKIVVCGLENILRPARTFRFAEGVQGEVVDGLL